MIAYSGNDTPENYLLCDGAELSRTVYNALFNAIGTTYGEGDGSTTFNIPNTINRVLEGGTAGSYVDAGLPNIIGSFSSLWTKSNTYTNGAFYIAKSTVVGLGSSSNTSNAVSSYNFYANLSNGIYGASGTVQMAAVITRFLIRYT